VDLRLVEHWYARENSEAYGTLHTRPRTWFECFHSRLSPYRRRIDVYEPGGEAVSVTHTEEQPPTRQSVDQRRNTACGLQSRSGIDLRVGYRLSLASGLNLERVRCRKKLLGSLLLDDSLDVTTEFFGLLEHSAAPLMPVDGLSTLLGGVAAPASVSHAHSPLVFSHHISPFRTIALANRSSDERKRISEKMIFVNGSSFDNKKSCQILTTFF
jgi:hypothetical protein